MFGSRSYRGSVLCRQPPLCSLVAPLQVAPSGRLAFITPPRAKHEQSRFGSLRHMHANIFRQSEHVTRSRCFSKRLALEACSEVLDARVTQFKEQAQVAAARDMIALATIAAHARAHAGMALSRIGELTS